MKKKDGWCAENDAAFRAEQAELHQPKGCPKCGKYSGDDWSQCEGDCPIPMSPHYRSLDEKPCAKETVSDDFISGQWAAFDKVLNWVNAQESKTLTRKEVYHSVMDMRPDR